MPGLDDPAALAQSPLFQGLGPDELARLNAILRRRVFAAGANIVTVEEPGEQVYILLDGTVKVFVYQVNGREVILAFLGPGDTVGEMSLVDSAGRSANVVTLEPSTCLVMDRAAFHESLRSIRNLSYNLARLLSRRLRLANEQIQALSTLDLRGRLARQILAFAEQYGRPEGTAVRIPLRLTQTDLAALVGASRERVNQVIVDFKHQGLIAVDPSYRITVLDRETLVEQCQ